MERPNANELDPDHVGFLADAAAPINSRIPAHGLMSPAASSVTAGVLPSPRHRPLRPGGAKESAFINYLDAKLRAVQRRFGLRVVGGPPTSGSARRHDYSGSTHLAAPEEDEEEDPEESILPSSADVNAGSGGRVRNANSQGYTSFVQAAADISRLVSMVWVSGTPSLQIHYLLTLALLMTSYIPSFPVAPKSMFGVLTKLDYAFASLVQGRDLDTGTVLPGFWGSSNDAGGLAGLDETTKVRIRSLVERTRILVVDVMNQSDAFDPADRSNNTFRDASDSEMNLTDDEMGRSMASQHRETDVDDDNDDWDMEVAKVYDRTLVELGGTLGADNNPMLTAD